MKIEKTIIRIIITALVINTVGLSAAMVKASYDVSNKIEENSIKIQKDLKNTPHYVIKEIVDKEPINKQKKIVYPTEINNYYDLKTNNINISVNDMNTIIDYWSKFAKGTPFKGNGEAFIKASKISGLDPIYLLAHAAWESDWGRSYIARTKGNYYGIAAYDNNPVNSAYHMGNTLYDGIINGAIWINNEYYSQGYTSLDSMIYGGKMYASAKDKWIHGILSIMKTSYSIL